jgi:alpha,alpha-trehalase
MRTSSFWLLLLLFINLCWAEEQSPADHYGELFEQVQLQKIFADGKTFVDAQPKLTPEKIMADYHQRKPLQGAALKAFVMDHFNVPEGVAPPPAQNERLPLSQHIAQLWPQLQRPANTQIAGSSLLPLPEPYVVPGGRFREIYYWDSYFTMLGLAADGRTDLVKSMLNNFESLITSYGHIPNGNRSYYLSRSQPPFFALMLKILPAEDQATAARHLAALQTEHQYWMKGADCLTAQLNTCKHVVRMDDGSLLNRYWDERSTPRDESYAEDVHTALNATRPKAEIYRHLRAGAESGWDFSSRWLKNPEDLRSIHTTDIVPVDLNSLLWIQEREIARLCQELQKIACNTEYQNRARQRAFAIQKYMWVPAQARFADFDLVQKRTTPIVSAATLFPLFAGLASEHQAKAVTATTRDLLLASGGLRTTPLRTHQQWDSPNGWAPLQWIAVVGLRNYGEQDLAREIAQKWLHTVSITYAETGKLLEKYDVEERRPGGGGEYPLQDGFGWTNGVVRSLMLLYPGSELPSQ